MTFFERFKLKHDKEFINFQKDFCLEFRGCKTYILEWFKFATELEIERRCKEELEIERRLKEEK